MSWAELPAAGKALVAPGFGHAEEGGRRVGGAQHGAGRAVLGQRGRRCRLAHGLGYSGPRRHLVVHVEHGQLRADHHKRQVVVPDPGFAQRAVDEHVVEIQLAVPALAAAVEKEEDRPAAVRLVIVARGQVKQEFAFRARSRAEIGDPQQL